MIAEQTTVERQRRAERKRLAFQIVRLCLSGRGRSPAIKHLQAECRVLERADQDLPTLTREVVRGG